MQNTRGTLRSPAVVLILVMSMLFTGPPAALASVGLDIVHGMADSFPFSFTEIRPALSPLDSAAGRTSRMSATHRTTPLSLVSADFNEDGMPDAVCGYGSDKGEGTAELRWGNPDSLYPNSTEALERKKSNLFSDAPFGQAGTLVALPVEPDYLAAGDFNGDGHQDLAIAKRGGTAFYVIPGNGRGRFGKSVRIVLHAPLSFLAGGDVNRRDGLEDIIVGIQGPDSARLMVFEGPSGALNAKPEVITLPDEALEVVSGKFGDGYPWDMAVRLASGQVMIIPGRDRMLSFEPSVQAAVPKASPVPTPLTPSIGLAAGKFLGDGRDILASLSPDGNVYLFDPRQPSESPQARTFSGSLSAEEARQSNSRLTTISTAGADLLAVLRGGRSPLTLLAGLPDGNNAVGSLSTDTPIVSILPMRLDSDAFPDLLVLTDDPTNPLIFAATGSKRTFVVNSGIYGEDVGVFKGEWDGICADNEGKCTLNAAMFECAGPTGNGTCTIKFNIPGSGVPEVFFDAIYSYTKPCPGAVYDGTTQPGGKVKIVTETIDPLQLNANTVLRGLILDYAEVGDHSTVERCWFYRDLVIASDCRVGGTSASSRNTFWQRGGIAGLQIRGNRNVVAGNWFGYDSDPYYSSPSAGAIRIDTPYGQATGPSDNVIGGLSAKARNIIVENVKIDPWTSGNRFQGNYLGTDPTGTKARSSSPSMSGITLGGIGTTVGGAVTAARNVIVGAGNGSYGYGVTVVGKATATRYPVIQGNYIGVNAAGTAPLGRWQRGVVISPESESITVGGAVARAGNVISGSWSGVHVMGKSEKTNVQGTSRLNVIQGNYIGTDKSGKKAIPNDYGILIMYSPDNLVGGTTALARNIISGNLHDGIHTVGDTARNNTITGNYIGVDATGKKKLPQPGWGVYLESADNTIGGLTAKERNVISANGQGNIRLSGTGASGNRVRGNYLGPAADGKKNPGGGYWGLVVAGGASNNVIGGRETGAGNLIAFNTETGVVVITDTSVGNSILGNSIIATGKMPIDLKYDGVTGNDYQDKDTGPNQLQNAPELTATETATGVNVNGKLHSTPGTSFRLEFFSSCTRNSQNIAGGEKFLGAFDVTTSSMGDALFSYLLPRSKCHIITATATDPSGNTSEFSLWKGKTARQETIGEHDGDRSEADED